MLLSLFQSSSAHATLVTALRLLCAGALSLRDPELAILFQKVARTWLVPLVHCTYHWYISMAFTYSDIMVVT